MKRVLNFLVIFVLLALMLGLLIMSGTVYNAGKKLRITTSFFSVNSLQNDRIPKPKSIDDLGDSTLRDLLVKKYVIEYFYVIPDIQNIEQRIQGSYTKMFPCKWCLFDKDGLYPKTIITPLYGMGTAAFEQWRDTEAQKIKQLAEDGALRIVDVKNISVGETGYLIVDYELKTWFTGNNMYETPTTTKGRLYMDVEYTHGIKQSTKTLQRLEDGWDAAAAFNFVVSDVIQE